MAGYYYSENSKRELASCHPDLQRLFSAVSYTHLTLPTNREV